MGTDELSGQSDKMLGGNLRWTSIPSRRVAIFLVAMETGVKRQPDKPLARLADRL